LTKITNRKVVIVNQAANYLTVGIANAFADRFENVTLICGSIHEQGEKMNPNISIRYINKWHESPTSKKFMSYFIALFRIFFLLHFKFRKHEVLFISVPPMAYLLNLIVFNRFSMIIWDVYPDTFKIVGLSERSVLYKLWSWLNKRSFNKAYKLFTISERMADLLEQYVKRDKLIIQPIWSIFNFNEKIRPSENIFIREQQLESKFVVQYSGNIGLTHNVETLLEVAGLLIEEEDILFQIIGRGPRKSLLEKKVLEKNLCNCQFLPFQSDEMFPFSISAAHLGVVILDDRIGSGSVPSKSYNLMSLGIPSLYIASKQSQLAIYASQFNHAECFDKLELNRIADYVRELKNNQTFYEAKSKNASLASEKFTRQNANEFIKKYLNETNPI
jgi:glycosyltransferase involved in cell wall biosynthesis